MIQKNIFGLLAAIICISGCISCNKYLLSEKDKEVVKEDILIETFDALSNVDLSKRTDWIMILNYSYIYNYTIDGEMIKAFPRNTPCFIPGLLVNDYNNGSGDWVGPGAGPFVLFASQSFYSDFLNGNHETSSRLFDQSTEEKLLAADCLNCQYTGKASSHLFVNLIHYNGFLDFELKNVPASATVMIESQMPIKPFRDKENPLHYKAIVFANWGDRYSQVHITMEGKLYIIKLVPTINLFDEYSSWGGSSIKEDTYYKFTLSYDKELDTFTIGDIQNEVWSKKSINFI